MVSLGFPLLDQGVPRTVEAMRVAAAARRRSAASVEEDHAHALAAPEFGQATLGPANAPVGGEIPAILGAVREPQHDHLPLFACIEDLAVGGRLQKSSHDGLGVLQIVDGLEQGHDIQAPGRRQKTRQSRQHEHHHGILGSAGVADDHAMEPELAVALLDFRYQAKNFQGVLGKRREAGDGFCGQGLDQAEKALQHVERDLLGRLGPGQGETVGCREGVGLAHALRDLTQTREEDIAALAQIERGEVESEEVDFDDEIVELVQKQTLVIANDELAQLE